MAQHSDENNPRSPELHASGRQVNRASTDWVLIGMSTAIFLIAVFAPLAWLRYRHTRERAQIKENLRQIGLALEQYAEHQSTDLIKTEPPGERQLLENHREHKPEAPASE